MSWSSGLQARVSRGLFALFFRQIIANGAVFVGNAILSQLLTQSVYGIFAVVLAFQQTLLIFSDVGLGAALVQRKSEPTEDEISAIFTIQVTLFCLVATVIGILAPWISNRIALGNDGTWLIRGLCLVLVVTAFRSIPAMLLERDLNFGAIAVAETVSAVIYQVVLVVLVWQGMGIASILVGLAIRYACDLFIILYFRRWRPRLTTSWRTALPYIRFGLGMQGVRVLGYAKDQLPILLLAPFLGANSVGEWAWAISYIGIPIYFNRLVDRIAFPAYARAQHDPEQLQGIAQMTVWMNCTIGIPIIFILVVLASQLVPMIYGAKWLSAVPVASALSINMIFGFITGSLFPLWYGQGRSRRATVIFAYWVALTLLTASIGIAFGSLIGVGLAFSISTCVIAIWLIIEAKRSFQVTVGKIAFYPAFICTMAGLIAWGIFSVTTSWWLFASIFVTTYVLGTLILSKTQVKSVLRGINFRDTTIDS